ncbi:DNA replication licensing factor Mcm4 [Penicillium chermesinum]|nr:DNA replication licensing factor Mcm4 [Penicillium chermesinum]
MSSPVRRRGRSSNQPTASPSSVRTREPPSSPTHQATTPRAAGRPRRSRKCPVLLSDVLPIISIPKQSRGETPDVRMGEASSVIDDGDRTPERVEEYSSPINYVSSSSPTRAFNRNDIRSDIRSDAHSVSSGLFVSPSGQERRGYRRADLHSSGFGSSTGRRTRMFVGADGMPADDSVPRSDATFSNLNPGTSEAEAIAGDGSRTIWGTNVSLTESYSAFKTFLYNFATKYRMWADGATDEETRALGPAAERREYIDMLNNMRRLGLTMKDVMVDLALKEMDSIRADAQHGVQSRNRRGQDILTSDGVTSHVDIPDLVSEAENAKYKVLPFGLDKTVNMRDLDPADIDKVVSIKGLVIRTTPVIPDMVKAFFRCNVCGYGSVVEIDRGRIQEPTVCIRESCKSKNSMQLQHNRCEFDDKQVIKLQETPDNVPDGQTPHSVSLCVYEELVDVCKAGDRVEVTGIFRSNPMRVNPRQRSQKTLFKTYIDVLHIQKVDRKKMGIDTSTVEQEMSEQAAEADQARKISAEEEEKIKQTAARPDVYELLARSLAPSLYEMDDVKKGILLQLFGGTNKTFQKGGNPRYRGDINVLLCGDPSTAKSQLLRYVHKIAPRGVYTSGKGSSAVGLTAYVTRDPETRQMVLESGALVLSDGGVCCIDEFDKMNEATRSVLHEVMEQQTVSIAKAGIITTLNARTSILASANPIGSRYNPNLPVPQNIDLPPTLLSRFDLVYLVLDRADETEDRRLAKHLVSMYLEDTPENASSEEILPIEFLTAYITYAKTKINPVPYPSGWYRAN